MDEPIRPCDSPLAYCRMNSPVLLSITPDCITQGDSFALRIYEIRRSIQRHVVILLGQVILAPNCCETDILTVKSGGIPWPL
jgi:hypothetical protein